MTPKQKFSGEPAGRLPGCRPRRFKPNLFQMHRTGMGEGEQVFANQHADKNIDKSLIGCVMQSLTVNPHDACSSSLTVATCCEAFKPITAHTDKIHSDTIRIAFGGQFPSQRKFQLIISTQLWKCVEIHHRCTINRLTNTGTFQHNCWNYTKFHHRCMIISAITASKLL